MNDTFLVTKISSCETKAQNWGTDTILNGLVSIKCHAEPKIRSIRIFFPQN